MRPLAMALFFDGGMRWPGKSSGRSDSGGTIVDKDGIDAEKLEWVKDLKENRRGRISEYADHFGAEYLEGKRNSLLGAASLKAGMPTPAGGDARRQMPVCTVRRRRGKLTGSCAAPGAGIDPQLSCSSLQARRRREARVARGQRAHALRRPPAQMCDRAPTS